MKENQKLQIWIDKKTNTRYFIEIDTKEIYTSPRSAQDRVREQDYGKHFAFASALAAMLLYARVTVNLFKSHQNLLVILFIVSIYYLMGLSLIYFANRFLKSFDSSQLYLFTPFEMDNQAKVQLLEKSLSGVKKYTLIYCSVLFILIMILLATTSWLITFPNTLTYVIFIPIGLLAFSVLAGVNMVFYQLKITKKLVKEVKYEES
jgi:small-conductance mechanosensitive channel